MSSMLDSFHRFLCDECGSPFKSVVSLLKHKGEKPFECKDCGTRFEKRRSLIKHIRSKLRCKNCCKMFKKPENLEKHLTSICTSGRNTQKTPQEDDRNRLSKAHQPYECAGCLKVFKHLKCVYSHVKRCSMLVNMMTRESENGTPSGDQALAISVDPTIND